MRDTIMIISTGQVKVLEGRFVVGIYGVELVLYGLITRLYVVLAQR